MKVEMDLDTESNTEKCVPKTWKKIRNFPNFWGNLPRVIGSGGRVKYLFI